MAWRAKSAIGSTALRAALLVVGAVLVFTGTYLALQLAGLAPELGQTWPAAAEFPLRPEALPWPARAVVAGLTVIVGALLVLWATRRAGDGARRSWFVLTGSEDDVSPVTVAVSQRSIDAIVVRAVRHEQGIVQVVPRVSFAEDGWDVRCEVHVWTGVGLTGVADRLQQRVSDDLELHTGVPVARIRIDLELGQRTGSRRVA